MEDDFITVARLVRHFHDLLEHHPHIGDYPIDIRPHGTHHRQPLESIHVEQGRVVILEARRN